MSDKIEKKIEKAEKNITKEIAKAEKKTIASTTDLNVRNTVLGSIIGFVVWFGLEKVLNKKNVVETAVIVNPVPVPEITVTNELKIEPEDTGIAPQINNEIQSFW